VRVHRNEVLVGLEHEYRIELGGNQVDFRSLIHDFDLGQQRLDPGDVNAYRLTSGAVLTADGAEAEIALPPVRVGSGFVKEVVRRAAHGHSDLAALLPSGMRSEGYSTHLSVAVPDKVVGEVGATFVRTFAPAMMLLLDKRTSPGLLIRPRPGRLELGGEFIEGAALGVPVVFAVGSVLATTTAIASGSRPPVFEVVANVLPDDHRYGWFVDRRAFGVDLCAHGRNALLTSTGGTTVSAATHLRSCWAVARAAIASLSSRDDWADADAVVSGGLPLPCEGCIPVTSPTIAASPKSPFGGIVEVRRRDGFALAPVMATWDCSVLLVIDSARGRRAFVTVPRDDLERFLVRLDDGELDGVLRAYLARRPGRRVIRRRAHTLRPGLYDQLGPRWRLLAPERPPQRDIVGLRQYA